MNLFGRKHSGGPGKSAGSAPSIASTSARTTPPKQTNVLASLDHLRETIGNLEKRQHFLAKQAEVHLKEAAALKTTDKPAALLELKRYKLKMKEVEGLINTQASLEAQILALESASITNGVVNSVQVGHKTQKELQRKLDPEKIAQLQEDVAAQVDAVDEVNRTLGLQLGDPIDDDDLLKQLDELTGGLPSAAPTDSAAVEVGALDDSEQLRALEADIMGSMPAVPSVAPMPSVPKSAPHSPANDDEELARLAKEMEM